MSVGFSDPRVTLHITDGIKFVQVRDRKCKPWRAYSIDGWLELLQQRRMPSNSG
jgi:hypothetical protein